MVIWMAEKDKLVRINTDLIEEYRKDKPKLQGLTYTAIVDVMLRDVLGRKSDSE